MSAPRRKYLTSPGQMLLITWCFHATQENGFLIAFPASRSRMGNSWPHRFHQLSRERRHDDGAGQTDLRIMASLAAFGCRPSRCSLDWPAPETLHIGGSYAPGRVVLEELELRQGIIARTEQLAGGLVVGPVLEPEAVGAAPARPEVRDQLVDLRLLLEPARDIPPPAPRPS